MQMLNVRFTLAAARAAGFALDGSSLIPSDAEALYFERRPGAGGRWRSYAVRCGGLDELLIPASEMAHTLDALALVDSRWPLPSTSAQRVHLAAESWSFATPGAAERERDLLLALMLCHGYFEGLSLWLAYAADDVLLGQPSLTWHVAARSYRIAPLDGDWERPSRAAWDVEMIAAPNGFPSPQPRASTLMAALVQARRYFDLDVLSSACIVSGLSRAVLAKMIAEHEHAEHEHAEHAKHERRSSAMTR